MTRVTEKVPLSPHRNVQLSKSKAIILAAAGALSVATAATVTASTWHTETPAHTTARGTPANTTQRASTTQRAGTDRAYRLRATLTRYAVAATPAATLAFRGTPQQIARAMLKSFHWPAGQFSCLRPLWAHESGWSVTAYNPGSGAYGIPQALPGAKMASAGPSWQTNAVTQIRWGLRYIRGIYGSPCGAWSHEQATGWY